MSRPLRVLIDARMLLGRFSGVARVVTRLVDELAARAEVRVVALCGAEVYAPWRNRKDIEALTCTFSRGDRTPARRILWEETELSRVIDRAGVDVYHATWNSGIPPRCPVPALLTVHDLIPWDESVAGFHSRVRRWCHRRGVRNAARRADRVTAVSDFSRGQVIARLRLNPDRVVTVLNGVDAPPDDATHRASCPENYLLYVGGHERRKNLAGLLAGVRRYGELFGEPIALRLTGRSPTLTPDAATELSRWSDPTRVRFLGDIDDAELSRQYASARALLLLSDAEGFGLPVLEAMAHGCPVVAAARGALPEVVGDAGILAEPQDSDSVARAIHLAATPSPARAQLIQKGLARSALFSWKRTADTFAQLYYEVHRRTAAMLIERPAPQPARLSTS